VEFFSLSFVEANHNAKEGLSMRKHEFINSSRVFSSGVGSSHAVKAGDHLFLTGMTGRNIKGDWASLGHVEGQAKQVFENMALVLEEAGASWKDVVKLLIYLSHHRNWDTVFSILTSYLGDACPPISAVVVEFPDPNLLLEVDTIAFLGPKRAINPPSLMDVSSFHSSQAVVTDGLVHMRGQTAHDRNGKISGLGDIQGQSRTVWGNLKTICQEAGGSLEDLVKLNIYMTNPNFLNEVISYRRDTYPHIRPTSSSSFVGFSDSQTLIEVDGWAYLEKKEPIYSDKAWHPERAGSAQAILLDNGLMPIIGISARNLDSSYHGVGDIKAQCVHTMEIVRHILEKAGATYENVVKLTSNISHPAFAPVAREVRSQYLRENRPALCTAVVRHPSTLVLVKTEAWAYLGS
jgi:enamine deaminase RidA (YjgF/YER057c/UK114 family)